MNLKDLRQSLYLAALEQAMRAKMGAQRGDPAAAHLEIIAADELKWINSLSIKDLAFLKAIRIQP